MSAGGEHFHIDLLTGDAEPPVLDAALLELRELTEELQASRTRIVEAGDAARRRIERDLHDGAQQRLVTASMLLGTVIRAVERGEAEQLADRLARVREELDGGLAELRDLARGIHPAILGDLGLRPAVDALAARCGVPVTVHGDLAERPAPSVEASLYFTVAEALTNVARYAEATRAWVELRLEPEALVVLVADDGVGGVDPSVGAGLRGLDDRVATVGGTLAIDSPIGEGTRVHARLPI
jgi:signal transduction histidine kinase